MAWVDLDASPESGAAPSRLPQNSVLGGRSGEWNAPTTHARQRAYAARDVYQWVMRRGAEARLPRSADGSLPRGRPRDDAERAHPILRLQQLAGNAAVSAVLDGSPLSRRGTTGVLQRSVEDEGEPGRRPNLDVGDRGPGVTRLQELLRSHGVACPVSGDFDVATRDAVIAFQTVRDYLLPASGGVGPGTWKALDSTVNPRGVTTSSDPLVQLETYVLQEVLGGKVPEYIWAPVRCVIRLAYTSGTALFLIPKIAYDIYQGVSKASAAEGKAGLQHLFDTAMMYPDIIGDCLATPITIMATRYLDQFPHAGPTFRHFLHGAGTDRSYDMQEAIDQDEGLRLAVRQSEVLTGGRQVLTDFNGWTSLDWHYTFGHVDHMSAQLIDASDRAHAKVRIVVADPYQWHPDEFHVYPILHRALETQKQTGAQEFMQRDNGRPVVIDLR